MASSTSAFSPVRNNSVSSDESDGKTNVYLPRNESQFSATPYIPWWVSNTESTMMKPPMWTWWGLQNQRLTNLYRFPHFGGSVDDEKPSQSYIGLIAEAILSSPDEKLILSDIYGFILANYPYFRNKGTGWRNSIRHNLSLNDCFIKAGRSQNGKGHFWAINRLYIDDFRRGDFRRKRTYKRPSRGKKARAKIEAMMKRKAHLRYREDAESVEETHKTDEKDSETTPNNMTYKTENIDKLFVDDSSRTKIQEIKEEAFLEPVHLCGKPPEPKRVNASERVVPSSPEWSAEDYQHVDVCGTDLEEERPKRTPFEGAREFEETNFERFRDIRTRRAKPFDMDSLLAPERGSKDFGILREMYPMYYNIMNLGMRNLDPTECYGSSSSYCGHCCSMLGSFPSRNSHEMRRHSYPLTAIGIPVKNDERTREYMES